MWPSPNGDDLYTWGVWAIALHGRLLGPLLEMWQESPIFCGNNNELSCNTWAMITPINTFAFYTLSNILSISAVFLDMLYIKNTKFIQPQVHQYGKWSWPCQIFWEFWQIYRPIYFEILCHHLHCLICSAFYPHFPTTKTVHFIFSHKVLIVFFTWLCQIKKLISFTTKIQKLVSSSVLYGFT